MVINKVFFYNDLIHYSILDLRDSQSLQARSANVHHCILQIDIELLTQKLCVDVVDVGKCKAKLAYRYIG